MHGANYEPLQLSNGSSPNEERRRYLITYLCQEDNKDDSKDPLLVGILTLDEWKRREIQMNVFVVSSLSPRFAVPPLSTLGKAAFMEKPEGIQ